jgi:serine/threonine protein phosphatase PrpC
MMWRASSSTGIRHGGRLRLRHGRCRHAPTALLAMATAMCVQVRPVVTVMEAGKQRQHTFPQTKEAYGSPFLPQDVYYEPIIKEALENLRMYKRREIDENTEPVLNSTGTKTEGALTLIGYKGGPLEVQVNQDRALVVSPYLQDSKLLGVFDGHANLGELVSQYVVSTLPEMLMQQLKQNANVMAAIDIPQLLIDIFIELDKTAPAEVSGGCTATMVLQHENKIYTANAGDSRSMICVYRETTKRVQVVYISREDKPELPDEMARVNAAGGQVYLPVRGTSRVLYTDPETGMQSGLAMSRSIGDWEVGKLGVIPDPIVHVLDIPELVQSKLLEDCEVLDPDSGGVTTECLPEGVDDDVYIFAISATDGLMDFATPETVAQTVAVSLYDKDGPHLLTALEQLIYMAAQGWEQSKQGQYRDDIAIAVAQLRIPASKTPAKQ